MIEALPDFPMNVLAFVCQGHVTRADYETVLVPIVEKALRQQQKVRLYYQIGPEFAGIDPGAMWEDFKIGVGHLSRWERIAVVTDVDWIRHTIRIFSFLIPGEVKVFPTSDQKSGCARRCTASPSGSRVHGAAALCLARALRPVIRALVRAGSLSPAMRGDF